MQSNQDETQEIKAASDETVAMPPLEEEEDEEVPQMHPYYQDPVGYLTERVLKRLRALGYAEKTPEDENPEA